MFAVFATHADSNDPLAALKIGEWPEPDVPEDWVRVKISHASLNRHDLFTLRGISGHPEGINYPIILGNDAAGTLDDGTPVVIYPMMGSVDWRGDVTLDPLDDDNSRHSVEVLDITLAVRMRVIPIQTRRLLWRHLHGVTQRLAGRRHHVERVILRRVGGNV